jgi:hypothetical protein
MEHLEDKMDYTLAILARVKALGLREQEELLINLVLIFSRVGQSE